MNYILIVILEFALAIVGVALLIRHNERKA
jgi:hypothetical protein